MLVDLLQNKSFICGESWLLCHCRSSPVYGCICSMSRRGFTGAFVKFDFFCSITLHLEELEVKHSSIL